MYQGKNQSATVKMTGYSMIVAQGFFYASFLLNYLVLPSINRSSFNLISGNILFIPFLGMLFAATLVKAKNSSAIFINTKTIKNHHRNNQGLSKKYVACIHLGYLLTSFCAAIFYFFINAEQFQLLYCITMFCSGFCAELISIDYHVAIQQEDTDPFIVETCATFAGIFFTFVSIGVFLFNSNLFIFWVFPTFYALISMLFFVFLDKKNHVRKPCSQSTKKLEKVSHWIDKRIRGIFFMLQILFGIALNSLVMDFGIYAEFIALIIGIIFALASLIASFKNKFAQEESVMSFIRILLSSSIILAFLLTFKNNILNIIAIACFSALWGFFWSLDMSFILRQAKKLDISTRAHVCTSQIINNGGLVVGMFAGMYIEFSAYFFIGLGIIIISALLIPLDSHKSPDNIFTQQEKAIQSGQQSEQDNIEKKEVIVTNLANRYQLTSREKEALRWIMHGRSAKTIAKELYIAESTVKTHIYNLYKKMGVHTRHELMELIDNFVSTSPE